MAEAGPGIVLVGMPATGKSTVGRWLAERLERPFVDTDELVARRTGMPVPVYLERHGEPAFRAVEAEAVAEACRADGAVIGVGGGALLDPLNRWALWHHGLVAWLDLDADTIVARLRADPVARPTMHPYDPGRVAEILARRAPAYRAADLRIDASREPGSVGEEILARRYHPRGRRLFDAESDRHHPIGPDRARIVMGVELESDGYPAGVAVYDRRLPAEIVERLPVRARLPVAAGERAKRMRRLEPILEWMAAQRLERNEAVFAVGGGTVGDLAGTAAALYARGVPLIQVPTTWLAQADSAIGGKVAVDLSGAKNSVGAFWPPVAVVSDVVALRSLPVAARRDGIAESVKSAIIGDAALWSLLEARGRAALRRDEAARYAIVERSARLKLDVCAGDPFERAERRTLNLGHTIGHGLEIASGYRLRHGAAVALGLRAVAAIATGRGADPTLAPRLDALLADLGFALHHEFDPAAVRAAMLGDKKRAAGRQRWILPMRIGHVVEADDVSEGELERALGVIAA